MAVVVPALRARSQLSRCKACSGRSLDAADRERSTARPRSPGIRKQTLRDAPYSWMAALLRRLGNNIKKLRRHVFCDRLHGVHQSGQSQERSRSLLPVAARPLRTTAAIIFPSLRSVGNSRSDDSSGSPCEVQGAARLELSSPSRAWPDFDRQGMAAAASSAGARP